MFKHSVIIIYIPSDIFDIRFIFELVGIVIVAILFKRIDVLNFNMIVSIVVFVVTF